MKSQGLSIYNDFSANESPFLIINSELNFMVY